MRIMTIGMTKNDHRIRQDLWHLSFLRSGGREIERGFLPWLTTCGVGFRQPGEVGPVSRPLTNGKCKAGSARRSHAMVSDFVQQFVGANGSGGSGVEWPSEAFACAVGAVNARRRARHRPAWPRTLGACRAGNQVGTAIRRGPERRAMFGTTLGVPTISVRTTSSLTGTKGKEALLGSYATGRKERQSGFARDNGSPRAEFRHKTLSGGVAAGRVSVVAAC